jgi:pyruvate/2-oxoacid:ferredoxin oxidoreductase alpha subunit
MKKVIEGAHAAAYAVRDCRAEVVPAYPITPQTSVIELIASFCSSGAMKARFIPVESEHSAMAACIAASAAGARAFTATSSHGLALMHELLHWAARGRLPIVMVNANRALGVPWNLGADQTDSLAQRDTGWIQLYCETNQEIYDYVIQAFALAEAIRLPVMVNMEAFIHSHTSESVELASQQEVDEFLKNSHPTTYLDPDNVTTLYGGVPDGDQYMRFQMGLQKDMELTFDILAEIQARFYNQFGRNHSIVESYSCDDATTVLLTCSTISGTARAVLPSLRQKGIKLGIMRVNMFRPFPWAILKDSLKKTRKIGVVDRDISFGAGGILGQEVKAALYSESARPEFYGFVAGLGGKDVTPETIERIVSFTEERPGADLIWVDMD